MLSCMLHIAAEHSVHATAYPICAKGHVSLSPCHSPGFQLLLHQSSSFASPVKAAAVVQAKGVLLIWTELRLLRTSMLLLLH